MIARSPGARARLPGRRCGGTEEAVRQERGRQVSGETDPKKVPVTLAHGAHWLPQLHTGSPAESDSALAGASHYAPSSRSMNSSRASNPRQAHDPRLFGSLNRFIPARNRAKSDPRRRCCEIGPENQAERWPPPPKSPLQLLKLRASPVPGARWQPPGRRCPAVCGPGRCVALLDPRAGKSTLLAVANGCVHPPAGRALQGAAPARSMADWRETEQRRPQVAPPLADLRLKLYGAHCVQQNSMRHGPADWGWPKAWPTCARRKTSLKSRKHTNGRPCGRWNSIQPCAQPSPPSRVPAAAAGDRSACCARAGAGRRLAMNPWPARSPSWRRAACAAAPFNPRRSTGSRALVSCIPASRPDLAGDSTGCWP